MEYQVVGIRTNPEGTAIEALQVAGSPELLWPSGVVMALVTGKTQFYVLGSDGTRTDFVVHLDILGPDLPNQLSRAIERIKLVLEQKLQP